MDVEGADVGTKQPGGPTVVEDLVEQRRRRPAQLREVGQSPDEVTPMNVLDGHQADEVVVLDVMVEGHFRESSDGLGGIGVVDSQLLFGLTDPAVGPVENGEVETFFAAEVVVDHPLGGAGALGDLVHSRTRIAGFGEDLGGDGEQFGSGALRVALEFGFRLCGHGGSLLVAARDGGEPLPSLCTGWYIGVMKTSIATVSVSGSLVEKLHACADAGFDGVEIFEPDLIAAVESPEEIRALAHRLGLELCLYQPLRDIEGVSEALFADNLRRADATFATAARLGIDTVLVCSNVATATVDDDEVSADQLRRLGELATGYGLRIAFEALAWGKFVDDYRRSWRIVEIADHPAVGLCLDSFHVLSRGHDPSAIRAIPGEKIFFLQLADAPALSMDVLSWSRHHRLFPGEGTFDLEGFVDHVLAAGYTGPLSLEVFNDTFRQTDPVPTAVHAERSLLWLQDRLDLIDIPDPTPPSGFDFVEIKAEDTRDVEAMLGQLGFTAAGRHRSKPVTLWTAGDARVVLNEQQARDQSPHIAAIGLQESDPQALSARASILKAPAVNRRTHASEHAFGTALVPGGTEIFWTLDAPGAPAWVDEFDDALPAASTSIRAIDHVNLTQQWETADDARLFMASVFGLDADDPVEVPGPRGLIRSQVLRTSDGAVRIPLNVAPHVLDSEEVAQHVAFACDDVLRLARSAREAGLEFLRIPDNYYDYVRGRFGVDEELLTMLRDLGVLYDRSTDPAGGYLLHFYTRTLGRVFFEFVQRFDGYDGYGVDNAPVRLAAQR